MLAITTSFTDNRSPIRLQESSPFLIMLDPVSLLLPVPAAIVIFAGPAGPPFPTILHDSVSHESGGIVKKGAGRTGHPFQWVEFCSGLKTYISIVKSDKNSGLSAALYPLGLQITLVVPI
jgi:hypothetical protein